MDQNQNIPVEKLYIKPRRYLFRMPVIFMAVFALFGAVFITASQASPAPPNGYFEIVTYEGSVTPGREIGSVNVSVNPGGSGRACVVGSGTTDPAGGPNHGHIRLTCPASASGGSREFTLGDFSRDGYTKDAASPHQPGDKIHISGTGNVTTVSLVLDGIPPPQQPTSTAPPPSAGDPSKTKAPDGTLNIVTYAESGVSGNELGNVVVAVDQGGSNVYCDKRSATTDNLGKGTNPNYGHAHLTCPAAKDGGPRTYRLVSASKANYTISPDSPIQIGQTFRVSPGDNNLLITLTNTPGTALAPIPPPIEKPAFKENNNKKPSSSSSSKNDSKKDDNKKPPVKPSASCNALSNLKLSDCKENQEKAAESSSSSNTLTIYSSKGAYKYISLLGFTNTQCGSHKLKLTQAEGRDWSSGSFASLTEGNLVTLKTAGRSDDGSYAPLRLTCTSTVKKGEKRNLAVLFRKNKSETFNQAVRKTDVNSYTNSCIYIHEWGISRVESRDNGSCDSGGEIDVPSRKEVTLKVKELSNGNGTENVELTSPQGLNSLDCADAQRVSWQYARQDKTYVTAYNNSLSWKNGHCISYETGANSLPDGRYAVTLKFSGSKRLMPYTHDIMYRTVGKSIAKQPSKTNSNKSSSASKSSSSNKNDKKDSKRSLSSDSKNSKSSDKKTEKEKAKEKAKEKKKKEAEKKAKAKASAAKISLKDDTTEDGVVGGDGPIASASGVAQDEKATLFIFKHIAGKALADKLGLTADEDRSYSIHIQGPGKDVTDKANKAYGLKITNNPIKGAVIVLSSKNRHKSSGCGWNGPLHRWRDFRRDTGKDGWARIPRCTHDDFSLAIYNIPEEYVVVPNQFERKVGLDINDGRYIQIGREKALGLDEVMISITLQYRTILPPFTQHEKVSFAAAASKYWHSITPTPRDLRRGAIDIDQTTTCKPNQVQYAYFYGSKANHHEDTLAYVKAWGGKPGRPRADCTVNWNLNQYHFLKDKDNVNGCLAFVHEYGHLLGHVAVLEEHPNGTRYFTVGHSNNPDNIMYETLSHDNGHLRKTTGCH